MKMEDSGYLASVYRNRRVLITGASGFIGQHLASRLTEISADYAVIVRDSSTAIRFGGRTFNGDVRDRRFLGNVFSVWRPQVVFHLAGSRNRGLSAQAFEEAIDVNLIGTLRLLFGALECGVVENIVLMGTGEEYGRGTVPFQESAREEPVSAYSHSKHSATGLAQLMARSMGMPVRILRPSVAYGPGQHSDIFLPALINSLLSIQPFSMSNGLQTRDYIYIDDVVDALLLAGICPGSQGEIINIGSGEAVQINELVGKVESILGTTGLVRRGALPYRTGEIMDYSFDVSKAESVLGWSAKTSLTEGLIETVNWYLEQKHE